MANKTKIIIPKGASTNIDLGLVELTRQLRLKTGKSGGFGLGGRDGYGIDFENDIFAMRTYSESYECDCGWEEFYNEEKFKEKHGTKCYQTLVDAELIKIGWKKSEYCGLRCPKNLSYEEEKKTENKIRKKYCKQFGLTFPACCAVHCTCGRDDRFDEWYIEQIKKFKKGNIEFYEEGYPIPHKKTCALILPNFLYKPTNCEIEWYKYIGRSQEQKGKLPKNWLQKCIESIWKKGDCWYEIDMGSRNFSEILTGREEPSKINLCFNAAKSDTIIKMDFSSFVDDCVNYWSLSDILSDIISSQPEIYKKLYKLDKKYPALREKIRLDAIDNCKNKIKWFKMRIKLLTPKTCKKK